MYLESSFKMFNLSPKKRLTNASKLSAISLAFYINPFTSNIEMNKKIKPIKNAFMGFIFEFTSIMFVAGALFSAPNT